MKTERDAIFSAQPAASEIHPHFVRLIMLQLPMLNFLLVQDCTSLT